MSEINEVYEAEPAMPSFQQAVDIAADRLRNLYKIGRSLVGRWVDIEPMDDDEFFDTWARCQDSALLSRLYACAQPCANEARVARTQEAVWCR